MADFDNQSSSVDHSSSASLEAVSEVTSAEDEEDVRVRAEADEIANFLKTTLINAFKTRENKDPTDAEVEALLEELTEERIAELLGQIPDGSVSTSNVCDEEDNEEEDDDDVDSDDASSDDSESSDSDVEKTNASSAVPASIWGSFATAPNPLVSKVDSSSSSSTAATIDKENNVN